MFDMMAVLYLRRVLSGRMWSLMVWFLLFERRVPCDVDLCVASIEASFRVYGLSRLVVYYSWYVHLAWAVVWILRLVRAL